MADRRPRNLVNLETVTKAYGTTVLLDGVSLGVAEGDRVGVVGRNGGGKSTLLRSLTRREPADAGRVTHTGGLRVGALVAGRRPRRRGHRARRSSSATARRTSGPPTRGCATCSTGSSATGRRSTRSSTGPSGRCPAASGGGSRWRGPSSASTTCSCSTSRPTTSTSRASPGWPRHLARAGARRIVVVTHDRWFLDEVCTGTWEVHDGAVHAYEGGYSAYVLARAERDRMQATARRPPRQPGAQGARLAAARPARAHVQAAVPDRRGQRADRRRAAGARRRRADAVRRRAARQARSTTSRTPTLAVGDRVLLDHLDLAPRPRRPDRRRRRQRRRQDVAAAAADRRAAARRRAGSCAA